MSGNVDNKEQQLKYKKLRSLTIISIIIGIVILIGIPFVIGKIGYYDVTIIEDPWQYTSIYVPQHGVQIVLFYTTILTIVVFMVYPIQYLRKKNKEQLGITK